MRTIVIFAVAFLVHFSEATFGNHKGGDFKLSGNFHGLLGSAGSESATQTGGAAGGSAFSFGGNLHGLLKNHRLLGAFNKKETTTASPIDLGFEGDNEGYSVSTGDVAPEPIEVVPPPAEIPEPIEEIPEPVVTVPENNAPAVSGSASFSSSGGHNIHKILGDVVEMKVKLLQQAQSGINMRFDNHIRNFENLATKFNSKGQSGGGGSFHGGFSLHGKKF